jgi:hypothetical protein
MGEKGRVLAVVRSVEAKICRRTNNQDVLFVFCLFFITSLFFITVPEERYIHTYIYKSTYKLHKSIYLSAQPSEVLRVTRYVLSQPPRRAGSQRHISPTGFCCVDLHQVGSVIVGGPSVIIFIP